MQDNAMKSIRFVRLSRRWTHCAGVLTVLALWSGAALSLPDNPRDPPLPPSTMGEMYEDSNVRWNVRRVAKGPKCPGMVGLLRLQDGATPNEGRLEICADLPDDAEGPVWGVICDDYWTDVESGVACRQLGYKREDSPTARFERSFFGAGTGPFMLDDMMCEGTETQLLDCLVFNGPVASERIGVHNCRKDRVQGIRCLDTTGDATLSDLNVQDGGDNVLTIFPSTFQPGRFGYSILNPVPTSISELTVYAQKNDPNASVEYFDDSRNSLGVGPSLNLMKLRMGWTTITIDVTADDGTVMTYSLGFDRR